MLDFERGKNFFMKKFKDEHIIYIMIYLKMEYFVVSLIIISNEAWPDSCLTRREK